MFRVQQSFVWLSVLQFEDVCSCLRLVDPVLLHWEAFMYPSTRLNNQHFTSRHCRHNSTSRGA